MIAPGLRKNDLDLLCLGVIEILFRIIPIFYKDQENPFPVGEQLEFGHSDVSREKVPSG